jgi:hypothetical protein
MILSLLSDLHTTQVDYVQAYTQTDLDADVDDCLFFSKDPKTIEELFTDEGDVGNFLGMKVERQKNGSINLTQPGLIDKIIETVGLESNSSYLTTPSSGPLLTKDSEGKERRH